MHSFGNEFEFELIRTTGGVEDLFLACTEAWTPIRVAHAIASFKRLVRNLGGDAN